MDTEKVEVAEGTKQVQKQEVGQEYGQVYNTAAGSSAYTTPATPIQR